MTDWMSKIVLFETVDELTDYKKKIENRYKAKTEKYVGKLQEEYFDFEKCDLEDQARILVINALTEAWMLTGLQRIVDQRDGELTQEEAEKMIMSNALACAAVSIKYLSAKNIAFSSVILKLLKKDNIRALDEWGIIQMRKIKIIKGQNFGIHVEKKIEKEKQNGSMMIRCFARRFYMHRR